MGEIRVGEDCGEGKCGTMVEMEGGRWWRGGEWRSGGNWKLVEQKKKEKVG